MAALMASMLCSGQSVKTYLRQGDAAFQTGDYYTASEMYRYALDKSGKVPKIMFKYANACLMNNDFANAEDNYEYLYKNHDDKYPLALFRLGLAQKGQGKYQKAQISFRKYYKTHRQDRDYYSKKAKHEYVSCENALYLTFEPKDIEIVHLDTNVNTEYSEFATYEINDSLMYYSSLRPVEYEDTSFFYTQVYQAVKNEDSWQGSGSLDSIINTPHFHVTNMTFSPDEQTVYYSKCPADRSEIKCGIWKSRLVNGVWQEPEQLPDKINKPGTNTTHPYMANTKEGNYLLFVSDRNGGEGGLDIWYSPLEEDDEFGKVKNIGNTINSMDDEITPFYDRYTKTLYFSSQWHNNLGGFDVFSSKGDFNYWEPPLNIGYPLNSDHDDYYYSMNTKRTKAYMSSNRIGSLTVKNEGCCNDIYMYKLPKEASDSLLAEQRAKRIIRLKEQIEKIIPITLYFHNDRPNPDCWDTITELNYETTVKRYLDSIDIYRHRFSEGLKKDEKEAALQEIDDFFMDYVEKGYDDLSRFSVFMEELLMKDMTIVVTIKGFCSRLHSDDYNINLAKRRISSMENYISEYKDGFFRKFIESGQLSFERVPFGESLADESTSDDWYDQRNSVYNPAAALERRIQILAVSVTE